MNATGKFAGFTVGLVVIFGAALALGSVAGPDVAEPAAHSTGDDGHGAAGHAAADPTPGGLTPTADGYTLELAADQVTAGPAVPVQFRITDPSGVPVTEYTVEHEKPLHLIVVRRDLAGFQHVHPTLDAAGTWTVPLDVARGGDYRVFADFTPAGGEGLTLGTDLRVAGTYDPQPTPAPTPTATVDGYTVALDGTLRPGETSNVALSVSRDGQPVTDLQPYLGAYGHLVALRTTDLGYLHVHPDGHPGDGVTAAGPGIDFAVTAPSAGDYRLFLDFQHAGAVHTAEFTVTAAPEVK
ncbi:MULTISPECIES: hypothetical protein [unclassified Rhodococcus (in: high G+C Gram-positive bacteria)]|uniref:hypothetical protein n=1 Tax=unclassified Rhodococcus (in: high G+C Gram-positive bacteria) TaxID=192944 RepID=UPI00163A851B|nr:MULTISPECIES: hypothetical protein [unclassified Rhodococcus (in: high G+C Gram-positive bacteria)]MBC2640957.1 hypothetical protein [Rhodococcus sp. 3A]MBC2894300.1 hypothetical protein [Rhodococcus sp. 4CII]